MRKRRNILLVTATALMCAMSFVLPGAVLALRDAALTRSTETVAVDEVELNLLSRLDAVQKLTLASDASAVSIPLEGGRSMDVKDVYETAYSWAEERGYQFSDVRDSAASAELRVGSAGEGAIMWNVAVSGPCEAGRFIIDDETGWVLGVSFYADYMDRNGDGITGDRDSWEPPDNSVATEGKTYAAQSQSSGEVYDSSDPENAEEAGEIVTPSEEFHYAARAFLRPMGIEYTIITRESADRAQINIAGDSGTAVLPIRLLADRYVTYLSINMPASGVVSATPVP